ncbi:hypothetical protein [Pseudomonas sp.]|uniref:hypothetical protein n=1 Tax=Pseudomonas sp. TaxID=306 RepID=UPI003D6E2A4B
MAVEVASDEVIRKAVLTLLGSLPPQTQMRFYWSDEGQQCFEFLDAKGQAEHCQLIRHNDDGKGTVMPLISTSRN